ncbi:MAG TPA: maleylpyruvate isomerase family mycothiol-dependent enzyme [Actinocrinis sp.]|nr:maleylpyruvate isomerase family mycothiol-dependent enzyme [Actinocrinis sp.]
MGSIEQIDQTTAATSTGTPADTPAEPAAPTWDRAPYSVAYRASRERVTRLLQDRPDVGDHPIPACPDWTVRDILAHVVEICRKVDSRTAQVAPGEPLPPTEAPMAELLALWARTNERAEPLIDGLAGLRPAILAMDVFTHEIDLHQALGAQVDADHPSYPGSLDLVVAGFSIAAGRRGLAGLRIETPGAEWTVGGGAPTAVLRGHRHDLYRSLTGRRTPAQIARLFRAGDPAPWLPAFTWGPFRAPAQPVEDLAAAG